MPLRSVIADTWRIKLKAEQLASMTRVDQEISKIEAVGPKFNLEHQRNAQELTKRAVQLIASRLEVGMSEMDGHVVIEDVLSELGAQKKWHPSKFRIGKNTLLSFREVSDPEVKLGTSDIFFIDLGPVFNDHEGDYGKTFAFGYNSEYEKIALASEKIFLKLASLWRTDNLTGADLYKIGKLIAKDMGYILNNKMSGHRVGDFPHHLYYKGKLDQVKETVGAGIWILEILIRHPTLPIGAFFEDVLS